MKAKYLLRGSWARTLLSCERGKAGEESPTPHGHPLLPAFKHSVHEPDGWSSGSQLVVKRQQVHALRMAGQEEDSKAVVPMIKPLNPLWDHRPSAS